MEEKYIKAEELKKKFTMTDDDLKSGILEKGLDEESSKVCFDMMKEILYIINSTVDQMPAEKVEPYIEFEWKTHNYFSTDEIGVKRYSNFYMCPNCRMVVYSEFQDRCPGCFAHMTYKKEE